jgi:hypothetical protein
VRLKQEQPQEEYHIPVEGLVERLVFDPDSHLLKTATVIQKQAGGKAYRYGPNPVSSELMIQFPDLISIDKVRISNLSGQEVYIESRAENPLILDLSFLADGPYLLELKGGTETYTELIVKISSN